MSRLQTTQQLLKWPPARRQTLISNFTCTYWISVQTYMSVGLSRHYLTWHQAYYYSYVYKQVTLLLLQLLLLLSMVSSTSILTANWVSVADRATQTQCHVCGSFTAFSWYDPCGIGTWMLGLVHYVPKRLDVALSLLFCKAVHFKFNNTISVAYEHEYWGVFTMYLIDLMWHSPIFPARLCISSLIIRSLWHRNMNVGVCSLGT